MVTFYNLLKQAIPSENIVKVFKNDTCTYMHSVTCDRCFGKGVVHTYGVCFKCNGSKKIITKSKGYSSISKIDQLVAEELKQKELIKSKSEEREELQKRIDANHKKIDKIFQTIIQGGEYSNFSHDLAYKVENCLTKGINNLSKKQWHYIGKFINQSNCPEDKRDAVKNFINEKVKDFVL